MASVALSVPVRKPPPLPGLGSHSSRCIYNYWYSYHSVFLMHLNSVESSCWSCLPGVSERVLPVVPSSKQPIHDGSLAGGSPCLDSNLVSILLSE